MLEKAFQGSKAYWSWVIFLLILIGVGTLSYLKQFNEGLGVTGMSRDVSWGFYIAQFTFLVGVAASAVMVVLPYYLHNYKQFSKITILGEFLAIGAVLADHPGIAICYRPIHRPAARMNAMCLLISCAAHRYHQTSHLVRSRNRPRGSSPSTAWCGSPDGFAG